MTDPMQIVTVPQATEPKPVRITGTDMVVDLRWAKRSCKSCYGTGFLGTRLTGKKREQIVCSCIAKEYVRRQRALGKVEAPRG